MSTKSHIHYCLKTDIEIYHETSDPRSLWGDFKGYDIYMFLPNKTVKEWTIQGDHIVVEMNMNEQDIFPEKIKFWAGWLVKVSGDDECIMLIIHGGSLYDIELTNKNFNYFNADKTN